MPNRKPHIETISNISYLFSNNPYCDEKTPFELWGWEIGNGWEALAIEALHAIAAVDINKEVRVAQIKEKLGYLNIYLMFSKTTQSNVIQTCWKISNIASNLSSQICEVCGKKGKRKNRHDYIQTLCTKHAFLLYWNNFVISLKDFLCQK